MAEASKVKVGVLSKVYRNTGTYGSPTWAAVDLVRDVTISGKWNRSDASARQTKALLQAKTQIAITGSLTIRSDDADAGYQALYDASMSVSDSAPDLLILDGAITVEGAKGFRFHANLDFEQDQSIGNVLYTTMSIDPAWNAGGYPSYAEVGSGSTVTFTAF